jgi:hypothetical protein
MDETWISVKFSNGRYAVSNLGRIKSIERVVSIGSNNRLIKETIIKPIKTKSGYMVVNLTYPSRKQHLIHRIVADAFIGISEGLVVNHLDLNKENNSTQNLEVVTQKRNIEHSCENEVNGRMVLNKLNGIYYFTIKDAAESIGLDEDYLGKRLRGAVYNNTYFSFV